MKKYEISEVVVYEVQADSVEEAEARFDEALSLGYHDDYFDRVDSREVVEAMPSATKRNQIGHVR